MLANKIRFFSAFFVLIFIGFPVRAELPEGAVGQIKNMESGVSIQRSDAALMGNAGDAVFEGDVVRTDDSGSVGITFIDGTVLSLGPESEMELESFVFEPQEKKLGFAARFLKGTATYLSGRIAKLSPDTVDLSTPYSTIGIRGTRLLIKVGK